MTAQLRPVPRAPGTMQPACLPLRVLSGSADKDYINISSTFLAGKVVFGAMKNLLEILVGLKILLNFVIRKTNSVSWQVEGLEILIPSL